MDLRNVRFAIDKAAGWPKLHDDGLADMSFGGKGLSVIMNLAAASNKQLAKGTGISMRGDGSSGGYLVDPRYVRVRIDRLRLVMHDTRRDWLYKLYSPFLASRIKRQIETSIRDQLVSAIQGLDNITRSLSKGIFSQ